MAGVFDNLIKDLRELDSKQNDIAKAVIKDTDEEVIDTLQDQLFSGKSGSGSDITPKYTPFTKFLKGLKGQPTDRVTLKDTGKFYKSQKVKFTGKGFDTIATDPKTKDLTEKYGEEVLMLSEESLDEYREESFDDQFIEAAQKFLLK
jgi:hypothetical protein